jgi:hypothetical protein
MLAQSADEDLSPPLAIKILQGGADQWVRNFYSRSTCARLQQRHLGIFGRLAANPTRNLYSSSSISSCSLRSRFLIFRRPLRTGVRKSGETGVKEKAGKETRGKGAQTRTLLESIFRVGLDGAQVTGGTDERDHRYQNRM